MPILVAEVDQAGDVEQELDKVVQHQQDQTQAVQAEKHKETSLEKWQEEQRTNTGSTKPRTSFEDFKKRRFLLENVGASDVGQVQEDVHKLTRNILLNSRG